MNKLPSACRICGRTIVPEVASSRRGVCQGCFVTRRGPVAAGADPRRRTGILLGGDPLQSGLLALPDVPVPGSNLGGFVVGERLGEGGMGLLLAATDPELGRRVAVKFLRRDLAGNDAAVRRFRQEGRALASLHHQSVLRVYSVGNWRGWPYLVMELVEGTNLAGRIEKGPIPVDEALGIAEEVAGALAAVHAAGLVHRDVKPDNIMLRARDGTACLVDFGLATGPDRTPTAQGIAGTAHYLAPEQISRAPWDRRVDIYSFGVTLFEAIAGRVPHSEEDSSRYLQAVSERDAPFLRTIRPDVPPAVEALLAGALARAPELRYADGADLLARVRAVRSALRESGEPAPRRGRADAGPAVPVPSRDPKEAFPLVGRDAEYATLVGTLDDVALRRGRVVLVEGEAGSGKSRLLRELERAAKARAMDVATCTGAEYPGSPCGDLRAALLAHARAIGAGTPQKAASFMAGAAPGNRPLAPALRWFLDPAHGEGESRPGRTDMFQAVLALLRAFVRERPLLLLAEDAHLLDEGSLELLIAAAEECGSWPVVLAFAFRPPGLASSRAPLAARLPRLRAVPGAAAVALGPLPESAVAGMIRAALRVDEAEAGQLAPVLHRKASGNPLFLCESLRLLEQERAGGVQEGPRRMRERMSKMAIPPRLLELASRRIAGLPEAERDALGVASIDPRGTPSDLVARCLSVPRARALRALQQLVKKHGLLREEGGLYRVASAEVREASYGELIGELRAHFHGEAARALKRAGGARTDPARLGRHLALAGEAREAVPHLLEAGRRLLAGHSPAEALDQFDEALRCAGDDGCPAAAAGKAAALDRLGDLDAARSILEGMMARGGEETAEAIIPLAEFERNRGHHREVLRVLDRAAGIPLPQDRTFRLHVLTAQAESQFGRGDAALAALDRAEAMASGVSPLRLLELWNTQGTVRWRLRRYGEARDWFEKALPLAGEMGLIGRTAILLYNLGNVCDDLGRRDEALEWTARAVESARLVGDLRTLVFARLLHSVLLVAGMRLEDAARELDTASGEVLRLDSDDARAYLATCRADLEFARGEFVASLAWAGRGIDLPAAPPSRKAEALATRAAALLELGRWEEALAEARQALDGFGRRSGEKLPDEALSFAARALREMGRDGPERRELLALKDTSSACAAAERAIEEEEAGFRFAWISTARRLSADGRRRDYLGRRLVAAGGRA